MTKVSVKKVQFKKPGQKKVTPPETDGLRKFYTSLLKQNKKSEMALKWMLEHGLLPKKRAEKYIAEMEITKKMAKITLGK
jgi:hypothetical protein